jgi:hypothetical protein
LDWLATLSEGTAADHKLPGDTSRIETAKNFSSTHNMAKPHLIEASP